MSILPELRERFRKALAPIVEDPGPLLELLRRSQDPKFGDYQANFAMSLGKKLGRCRRRQAYQRDHLWLDWHEVEGLGPASIRDRWNAIPSESRQRACPSTPNVIGKGESGRDVVKKALRRARKERRDASGS